MLYENNHSLTHISALNGQNENKPVRNKCKHACCLSSYKKERHCNTPTPDYHANVLVNTE